MCCAPSNTCAKPKARRRDLARDLSLNKSYALNSCFSEIVLIVWRYDILPAFFFFVTNPSFKIIWKIIFLLVLMSKLAIYQFLLCIWENAKSSYMLYGFTVITANTVYKRDKKEFHAPAFQVASLCLTLHIYTYKLFQNYYKCVLESNDQHHKPLVQHKGNEFLKWSYKCKIS